MASQQVVVGHEVVRGFVADIFAKAGSNPREAQLIAGAVAVEVVGAGERAPDAVEEIVDPRGQADIPVLAQRFLAAPATLTVPAPTAPASTVRWRPNVGRRLTAPPRACCMPSVVVAAGRWTP